MSKLTKRLILAAGVLVAILVAFAVQASKESKDRYEHFELFSKVVSEIEKNYVDEVDEEKLFRGAIKGMMETLDPYSSYIPAEMFGQFQEDAIGAFGGLGIEITLDENGWLTVIAPMDGTPASRAGVLVGDKILKIDGESTERIELIEAVQKLRGDVGTPVTITVIHQGAAQTEDITMTREEIRVQAIRGFEKKDGEWNYWVDPGAKIAYVRITSFQQKVAEDLDNAVKPLLREGLKGLIVDVRNNPGGLLSTAVEVSDRFIESGPIVSMRGRSTPERVENAHAAGTYPHFELVVLVNTWSASASEILAGAIQDHKRGVLVGSQTWGKGSVQDVIPLDGNRGGLKLTKAKYYTPSGRSIHRDPKSAQGGLIPDIPVPMTPEESIELAKSFREDNRSMFLSVPPKEEKALAPEELDRASVLERFLKTEKKEPQEAKFIDKQLERAIEYLTDVLTYKAAREGAAPPVAQAP